MFTKRQTEKYCDVLLWALNTARKKSFKKNDVVMILYDLAGLEMAEILQAKLLDMGVNPVPRMGLTSVMEKNFFEKANSRQLIFQTPGMQELYRRLNGSIHIYAPESLTHLSQIDPKKIGKAAVARKYLRKILEKREEQGEYGWTLCMIPTRELAKKAKLSMDQYIGQVVKACNLDKRDPVKAWQKTYENVTAIKEWINDLDIKTYHIQSARVDLKITPGKRRRWIGLSGHNIPSFEIFLSPDWRGTEGIYFADQPSFRSGNRVEGVRLEFKKGRLVKVDAKKGRDFVVKQLSMDEGAGRLGEFSLTDKRFSRIDRFMANTLFDENFGGRYGNCHVALGASYSDSYDGDPSRLTKERKKRLGFNDSALHWDIVNTEKKRVFAHLGSGENITIYEDGVFKCKGHKEQGSGRKGKGIRCKV
ncbi:MAG: aminopeptidase [Deltaproteobacteria bacterium]|nr:aminopeptidase [Deltaproteobacteria bacterium]